MPDALTLSEVRAQVLSEADWAPTQSDAFLVELDRYIWLASQRLVSLVPGLLHTPRTIFLQPPAKYNATVATDRASVVSGDRLVLERPQTTGRTAWVQDGRWDSRNLWVQEVATGEYRRFIAHEWWTDDTGVDPSDNERVSLDRPYPISTSDDMPWWVFTDPYALQGDVASVVEVSCWNPLTGMKWPLKGVTEREMERLWRPGPPTTATQGRPTHWSPGPRKHLRPLSFTPQVSNSGTWSGDDAGQRDYRLVIAWGRRDITDLDPHGNMNPVWRSPPSPASAKITATAGGGGAIVVTTPDINYLTHYTGLPTTGSAREGRSGYFVEIYERQYTNTDASPANDLAGYYKIGEVDGPGPFSHTGAAQRVYEVPLQANQDIPTIRVWPHPDQRYELDVRAVVRPRPFYDDNELVPIPPDASELLILDARRRLAGKLERPDIARVLEEDIQRISASINRANLINAGVTLERGQCDASSMNGNWSGRRGALDPDDIYTARFLLP